MAAFLNNCRFIPSAGGTSDWVYSSTVGGCQSPALAGAVDGRKYKFIAISGDLTQWEIAEGAYTLASGTFARTTVLSNSSGSGVSAGQSGAGTKISFISAPNVAIVGIKEDLISVEESNGFTAAQMAQARANIGVTRKNYLVNGGLQISQENGTTASTASGYYPADQWRTESSNAGTLSAAQVASPTPGGSPYRVRMTVVTADAAVASTDYCLIAQRIEGNRVADLRFGNAAAKAITVQFGVKAPAGTYCVAIRNGTPNRIIAGEYTIVGGEANVDVVKTVSFSGDTAGTWAFDHTAGMEVIFVLMAGSSFVQSPNSWSAAASAFATSSQFNLMATAGNVFELFDVGMHEGGSAPAFQLPDFNDELDRCQRYWEKSYDYATAVGTVTNNGVRGSLQNSAPASYGAGTFLKRKRVAPAVTLYSPFNGASGNGYDTANRATAAANVGETQYMIVNAFGSATTPILYHYTANARM